MPARDRIAAPPQTPKQIAITLEAYLADYPSATVSEDGKVLFDMREARYSLTTEHGRCTLHLWAEDRNLVRRVLAAELRQKTLRLATSRFGQTRPQMLDLDGDKDRRTPSSREMTRLRYVKVIERVLEREFPDWQARSFRTAMDLERSFGPAYARGLLVQRQKAWAVIAVNQEELPVTVDAILTFGILWLEVCRGASGGRMLVQGLRVIVPSRMGTLTLARMAWLNGDRAQWQLYELNGETEELEERDVADRGNIATRLLHRPNAARARERFATSVERVMAIVPEPYREIVEQRLRSATVLAFLLHGLEFARVRFGASADSFNREETISFGAGAEETPLLDENEATLRELVLRLCERRSPQGDRRDPLYRMQPERWLEGEVRRNILELDAGLNPEHVYTQVPAFAGTDRGMMDLLAVGRDGRLIVIELKAAEDPQLALQGLDYWIRVRWHQLQASPAGSRDGSTEFQRHGYFEDLALSAEPPRLWLVSPGLRFHPATEIVLRYFLPEVDWTLIGLGERWRERFKVISRRSPPTKPLKTW